MITRFKPTRIRALIAGVAAILALSLVTFTKATEKAQTTGGGVDATSDGVLREAEPEETRHREILEKTIADLKTELRAVENQTRGLQTRLDALLEQLDISDETATESKRGSRALETLNEKIAKQERIIEEANRLELLHQQFVELQNRHHNLKSFLGKLKPYKNWEELIQVLDDLKSYDSHEASIQVLPSNVSKLMADLARTEQALAALSVRYTDKYPKVQETQARMNTIKKQIERSVDGILKALETKVASYKAELDNLQEKSGTAKQEGVQSSRQNRLYEDAKRRLENLKRLRYALELKLLQEEINATLPPALKIAPLSDQ